MNDAEARQRHDANQKPIGLWDWTTRNDGRIWTSDPCIRGTDGCQHHTPQEAERHFYDYCLEQAKVHEHQDEQRRCAVCNSWTNKEMGNNQLWLMLRPEWLCDEHLNKESLSKLHPYKPGISIIHS